MDSVAMFERPLRMLLLLMGRPEIDQVHLLSRLSTLDVWTFDLYCGTCEVGMIVVEESVDETYKERNAGRPNSHIQEWISRHSNT